MLVLADITENTAEQEVAVSSCGESQQYDTVNTENIHSSLTQILGDVSSNQMNTDADNDDDDHVEDGTEIKCSLEDVTDFDQQQDQVTGDAESSSVVSDNEEITDDDIERTGTVVRRRRDADAFLEEEEDNNNSDSRLDDDEVNNGSVDDEYIGIVPMLCSRCVKWLKQKWPEQRAKHFVVVFNIFLSISGCLLVCVSLWMEFCQNRLFYGAVLLDNLTAPIIALHRIPMALFAVAVVIVFLSFIGACGAATECVCFLILHAALSVACIVTQIFVSLLVAIFRNAIHANMAASMQYQLRHLYNTTGDRTVNVSSVSHRITTVWNHIQQQLNCCGSLGPADYHYSAWFNHTPDSDGMFVPASCCASNSQPYYCQFEAIAVIHDEMKRPNIIRPQGCYEAILDWLSTYHSVLVFVLFFIDVLLIVDILSAVLLIRTARRKQSDSCLYDERTY